jgi:hypothetical protein
VSDFDDFDTSDFEVEGELVRGGTAQPHFFEEMLTAVVADDVD